MALDIRDLSFAYRNRRQSFLALDRLDLHIADREFVAILGPSGCGKSTLLHLLAGFLYPTAGVILQNGEKVTGPGQDRAILVQQNALFPWLTVIENIAYPLRIQGVPQCDAKELVDRWLARIALTEFAGFYPHQISIGMQQRVAVARLFIGKASVLLMDEPFGALDTVTRIGVQRLLLQIWSEERRTVLFVTHDVEEALLLADRVLVLGANPARLIEERTVPWPRPRDFRQLFSEEFVEVRRELLELIGVL